VQNACSAVEPENAIGDESDTNENMDMAAHVRTCPNFVALVNYFIGAAVFLLTCMAVFLT
jgi:hypothetical protein